MLGGRGSQNPVAAAVTKDGALLWPSRASFTVAILVLTAGIFRLARASLHQLPTPLDLNYESPAVATIEAFRNGTNVYHKSFYGAPPFGLDMYAPLYHYVVSLFPASADNPFLAGRIVALVCMVLAGMLLLWVAPGRARVAGLMAAGLFLIFWPVTQNAALVRVDSMALMFSGAAVVLIARHPASTAAVVGSAFLCLLALAAKQSFIAAPVACFLFLLHRQARPAVTFAATYGALAMVFLAGGEIVSGGGFLFSLTSGAKHPNTLNELWVRFLNLRGQPLSVVWAVVSLAGSAIVVAKKRYRIASPFPMYAATSWLVFLGTAGKMGAAPNYYLEPMLASLMLAVWYASRERDEAAVSPRSFFSPVVTALVLALLVTDVWMSKLWNYSFAVQPTQWPVALPR